MTRKPTPEPPHRDNTILDYKLQQQSLQVNIMAESDSSPHSLIPHPHPHPSTEPVSSNSIEHLSPNITSESTERRQAIPISSLINPIHLSPRIHSSIIHFDNPQTPPQYSSETPSSSPLLTNQKVHVNHQLTNDNQSPEAIIEQYNIGMPVVHPPEYSITSSSSQGDSGTKLPEFSPKPRISKSCDHSTTIEESDEDRPGKHYLKIGSSTETTDSEEEENEEVELESNIEDNGTTSTRPAVERRTKNPNVKTTKTGKILHKSKKTGVRKRPTAYNRFLQQRSKYYKEHRSELKPPQVTTSPFTITDIARNYLF
ncbi:hypothetical protein BGZ76_010271 [Entomortierella beljakovae]|nr:hypothetical protein BGZ76_010271 [Entomortierella beljakovae]